MYWNIKIVGNLLSLMQHPVVNYSIQLVSSISMKSRFKKLLVSITNDQTKILIEKDPNWNRAI